ncbi:MAG: tetratricopeptide repeat protein [Terrimicrobiaceae bacterium]
MVVFVVPLADLEFLSQEELSGGLPTTDIVEKIRQQFDYLPGELDVTIHDGVATIRFEEASQSERSEALRLFEKAGKRAASGEFQKARDIYRRVLELDPAMADARRELAMTLFELGDMPGAKDQLIDALRLKPDDAWSYVVLANIYVKHDRDFATAARFLTRALELKPGDPYALNSLAAVSQELGDSDKALHCFDEAIASNPEFANAWFGKALLFSQQDQPSRAVEVLGEMFQRARMKDTRSQPVFSEARRLYLAEEGRLAEAQYSDCFKALESFKAEISSLSGFPVIVQSDVATGQLSGIAQMAWKHGRDRHIVKISERITPPLFAHVAYHEIAHIRFEAEARLRGVNRWFATSEASREHAHGSLGPDLKKLERQGYSGEAISKVERTLVGGLCGSLFNTPLDLLIESRLHREVTVLRSAQFVSLHRLAEEALAATTDPEVRKITPIKILRASTALNGTAALFLDDLTNGATAFWPRYEKLDGASLSPRLFKIFQDRQDSLRPGEEYDLVDEFGEVLGLTGWFEWQPDPGTHELTEGLAKEGTTNPGLLKQKYPAAVWFLLAALKRYSSLPVEKVREIAFEIALLGQRGLDYASPEAKYTLRSLPGESFSGLQLMCLMHAGFQQIAPEHETGMDLAEPFLMALELFQEGESDAA